MQSLYISPPLVQVQAILGPKLYVVANGQGSPCMDFRRVPDILAEACIGTDLLSIEGMGRYIHCIRTELLIIEGGCSYRMPR